ncbi:MAG: hypothetical protein WCG97_03580 [bacterium]
MVYKIKKSRLRLIKLTIFVIIIFLFIMLILSKINYSSKSENQNINKVTTAATEVIKVPVWPAVLDRKEFDKRLLVLDNYVYPATTTATTTLVIKRINSKKTSTTTIAIKPPVFPVYATSTNVTVPGKRWPASTVYPNGDAILPFKRILAYYGNFYSTKMGILGEYSEGEVLRRLASTTAMWNAADPTTPILPAIEYIAVTAQGTAGVDKMYRAVMPDEEIEKAYSMAQKAKGILILDLQVGLSTVEKELPKFKNYMMRPDVHIAIDPEFSMKTGKRPGTVIGTVNSDDINYVINYLSNIVKENKLPPKVLLVHRFTEDMVTGANQIKPTPEVQVVIVMDGWGTKERKIGTYKSVIDQEPVQFTGIKLFYKNDIKSPSTGILSPAEVFSLKPMPIYIQYQ